MASGSDAEALLEANRALRRLGGGELDSLWSALELDDVAGTKRILLEVMPELVAKYGDAAATIAADLYEVWREEAQTTSNFRALMAQIAPRDAVDSSTRYAIGGLYRDPQDPDAVLSLLKTALDRHSMNTSRATFARNFAADPANPRWARVPVGDTCTWCLMQGSRGFRPSRGFTSEMSAAAVSHGDCDCLLVPSWAPGRIVDDYGPAAIYDQWQAALSREREASR